MSALLLLGAVVVVAVAVAIGVSVARGRRRDEELALLLGVPDADVELPIEALTERPTAVARIVVEAAERAARAVDQAGSLREALLRAKVPLRPGEFVVLVACGGLIVGALLAVLTESLLFGAAGPVAAPLVARLVVRRRIAQRQQALLEAFPDALGLVVASLNAGHTFLRSIQLMCEDAEPPLAEEFARVVAECELGDPLPDALERMAQRVQIRDVDWAVQAIRVQQEVGGALAEVLQNIAEFMRARQEVRREVSALTAEGRMSGWVLAGLPIFLVLSMQVTSPDYLDPMFQGWGIVTLLAAAASTVAGLRMIFRMVDSIEV